jgi:cupin 2 domain-containing protein
LKTEKFDLFKFDAPAPGTEKETPIVCGKNWRIVRTLSNNYFCAEGFWYDQNEDETVFVLSGWGEIEFENKTVRLHAGEGIFIPKNARHRVSATSSAEPCMWLCIYTK